MKISLYCDELYPYFGISNDDENGKRFSLSDEEYADYLEVQARWEAWQHKLGKMKPDSEAA